LSTITHNSKELEGQESESLGEQAVQTLRFMAANQNGGDAQPFDHNLREQLERQLEGFYQDYYRRAAGDGQSPESLLDRHIATREQYFKLLEQYATTRAVFGLASENVQLPKETADRAEEYANRARSELAELYTPLEPKSRSELSVSGAGRTANVHNTVYNQALLPEELSSFINTDLAEELKIAAYNGDADYVDELLSTIHWLKTEPFLRENGQEQGS
jgi:hypothetical protein